MTEELLAKLLATKKYAGVCPDTLRRVASECAGKYKKLKDAEKAAKETLHGITGAFMDAPLLSRARKLLESGDINGALRLHSSTNERMPLDEFYTELFSRASKPTSVLDVACGLNPVFLGSIGIHTTGVDISGAQIAMINAWATSSGAPVECFVGDALCDNFIPDGSWELALVMKLLPVLETQRKGSARALLEKLPVPTIVATFPTRTLGGRRIGMEQHYTEWFESIVPECLLVRDRYVFANELIYILNRN